MIADAAPTPGGVRDGPKREAMISMAFRTSVERLPGGRDVLRLSDEASGASASILPSYGFNLFDLRLPIGGKATPIIVASPGWADAPKDAGRNGIPILFPFPNRIGGGKYSFGGKTYQLPLNLGPNAIHGFALTAAWDLVEHGADAEAAFAVGRYHIGVHSPASADLWPTDATLIVRYALAGRKLTMTTTVSNPTDRDLPYGFGIHPYFRLPFAPGGDPAATSVVLPAAKRWALSEFLPTGQVEEVDRRLDFRKGQPRADLHLDDVLTGLSFEAGKCTCRLVDLARKAEFRLGFDAGFRELVVYTPNEPDVISLEPYTQTTDAIRLQPKGIDAGLRVLKHGQSDTFAITMETAETPA